MTPCSLQGYSRVKADEGFPGDERIGKKASILGRIRHDHHLVLSDGVHAKRRLEVRLAEIETAASFEPLSVFVNQTDQDGWNPEKSLSQPYHTLKRWFGRAVKHLIPA